MAMSLLTYQEARPWAKAIRNEVLARRMPPFDPVKGVGEFRDDPSLTQPEIELFVAWVEGGAPEGPPGPLSAQPALREASRAACTGQALRVTRATVLTRPVTLCGILPDGPLEVMALLQDQTVRRLIWIRDFHARWNRTYILQSPLDLPRGTRITVYSPKGAVAHLLTTH
jgi:hypothetical protein